MLILEKRSTFFERYNKILNETLKPEIIYLDKELIWKEFRKIFSLHHLKLGKLGQNTPVVLKSLSNHDIYHNIVRSCRAIIKMIK